MECVKKPKDSTGALPMELLSRIIDIGCREGRSLSQTTGVNNTIASVSKTFDALIATNPYAHSHVQAFITDTSKLDSLAMWMRREERRGMMRRLDIAVYPSAEEGFADFLLELAVWQPDITHLSIRFRGRNAQGAPWCVPSRDTLFPKLESLYIDNSGRRKAPPFAACTTLIGPLTTEENG